MWHDWFVNFFLEENRIESKKFVFRLKKDGTKVFSMGNWDCFLRIMLHDWLKIIVGENETNWERERVIVVFWKLDNKKDPPVKRKPVNGLSALISKEVCRTEFDLSKRLFWKSRSINRLRRYLDQRAPQLKQPFLWKHASYSNTKKLLMTN